MFATIYGWLEGLHASEVFLMAYVLGSVTAWFAAREWFTADVGGCENGQAKAAQDHRG